MKKKVYAFFAANPMTVNVNEYLSQVLANI